MANPRYVTVAECAEVLCVSKDLVYELVVQGVLPAVELGRRKVIPRKALDLIEERALEGFDPDAVLNRLAAAAGSAADAVLNRLSGGVGGEAGPTGTAVLSGSPAGAASPAASVVPIRPS